MNDQGEHPSSQEVHLPSVPPPPEPGSPGEGWWKASDGNWYPPTSAGIANQLKSAEERKALLARAVAAQVAMGRTRIETQSDYNAVIVRGQPVNHVLHLLITVFTCGLWAIVWIIMAAVQREHRAMVMVDEFGNVAVQQLN